MSAVFHRNDYTLRPPLQEEAEAYTRALMAPDPEVDRLTGTTENFSHDAVVSYFMRNFKDNTRRDFLILNSDSHIIGESMINEIDAKTRSANFRIAIFNSKGCSHGISSRGCAADGQLRLLRAPSASALPRRLLLQSPGQTCLREGGLRSGRRAPRCCYPTLPMAAMLTLSFWPSSKMNGAAGRRRYCHIQKKRLLQIG